VQAQYEGSQRSEDQQQQGGEPLNRNRFVVRRARLRFQRDWDYAALDVELDANTIRDVSVGLRRAAGAVFWPGPEPDAVPYVRAQAGLLDIPFGAELPAGARRRLFAERSTASLAMFPSESDVGATVDGGYGPLRYALAIMNGFESDGTFRVRDPNSAKDIFARVGVGASRPLSGLRKPVRRVRRPRHAVSDRSVRALAARRWNLPISRSRRACGGRAARRSGERRPRRRFSDHEPGAPMTRRRKK
jgi:hypothetical protein